MTDAPRQPHADDRRRYYEAALRVLRFVEHRSPTSRRFGAEADARWGAFKGHLTTSDRLDLLLRDANAEWPESFGARSVFALRAAAEDEAFGAEWSPMDPVDAEELWRQTLAAAPPSSLRAAIDAAAAAWDLKLSAFDVGAIQPTDKLVVAGPSAIAAVVVAFAEGRDLAWADQVVCVASAPAHRQLAALAGALLHANKPAAVLHPARDPRPAAVRRAITSPDAAPDDVAWLTASTQN